MPLLCLLFAAMPLHIRPATVIATVDGQDVKAGYLLSVVDTPKVQRWRAGGDADSISAKGLGQQLSEFVDELALIKHARTHLSAEDYELIAQQAAQKAKVKASNAEQADRLKKHYLASKVLKNVVTQMVPAPNDEVLRKYFADRMQGRSYAETASVVVCEFPNRTAKTTESSRRAIGAIKTALKAGLELDSLLSKLPSSVRVNRTTVAELGGPNVLLQFGAMGSERTPYTVQADGRLFLLTVLKRSSERPAGFDEIAKFVQHQFLEEAKLAAAAKVKRQLRSQLNVRLIHENKAFRTAATARNAQRK